jgi:hypothetical protein
VHPTEGFQGTLSKLVPVLDRFQIRFHLTGGIVSVAYGEPRLTQDIDVVLDHERVLAVEEDLLRALKDAGFHFSGQFPGKRFVLVIHPAAASPSPGVG